MTVKINAKIIAGLLLLAFGLVIACAPLSGQYLGRNKVQYTKFDFKVMKTQHFDIYFYPEFKDAAEQAARMAERWYARLSRVFNYSLKGRQALILYASGSDFQQTTVIPDVIGEGVGGFTESLKRRVVLPLGAALAETDHVIGHELVHAFQFDMTSQGGPRGGTSEPAALRLPLWFVEGLAEYLSIGPVDPHTAMWMRDAVRRKELPKIKKLNNPRYFPYRYGQALWAYIAGRWGDEIIPRIMKSVGRMGDHEKVLERTLGITLDNLSKDWHEAMKKAYDPILQATNVTEPASKVLLKGTEENVYNIAPSVSPDGKELISLSTRDLFSIDMYLADAATGKVKHRITRTATDPEFESLQFIRSAGSWEPGGKRFVFGAVSKGVPMLTLFNTQDKKMEREISIPELDEIINPAWSPDGGQIVFSAMKGGITDLYIYDLESSRLQRLTEDSFADLQPAWSPDGRQIAFITDRFSTDLSLLSIGNYDLAVIDPASGAVKKVQAFAGAKNINPQWSSDSKSLFFLSDQSGKTDVYRLDLDSGRIFQVTNLYTGVSGITDISPAISYANEAGRLVYSAYDEGNYTIFAVDSAETLHGQPNLAQFDRKKLSVLPPREQPGGAVLGLLLNPLFGLPEEVNFPVSEYKPKLALDFVGSPQVAVGVDRYGTYTGGGVTLYWSDMLGYHTVATMLQSSSRLKDAAALVGYQNTKSRWSWGAVAQRIPYVTGYYDYFMGQVYGEPAQIYKEYLYWQFNYDLAGFVSYPFNIFRRLELSSGYRYIGFDQEVVIQAFSLYDGTEIFREIQSLPSPSGISMGYASGAMVYDSAVFGATAPIIGQSYILQYNQVLGSLTYNQILGDYRRYFMPVKPVTLAFRFLHYGRYGKDAEDERLWPLFIGYDGLIRGYDYESFDAAELYGQGERFNFDRLFGSRMLIANAELRFPLFGLLGIGRGFYGVFPIDFYAFYDVGLAWDNAHEAWFLGGERKPLSSAGVGLRANLFGYFVLGVHYVKPLDRHNKNWYFQLSLLPGF